MSQTPIVCVHVCVMMIAFVPSKRNLAPLGWCLFAQIQEDLISCCCVNIFFFFKDCEKKICFKKKAVSAEFNLETSIYICTSNTSNTCTAHMYASTPVHPDSGSLFFVGLHSVPGCPDTYTHIQVHAANVCGCAYTRTHKHTHTLQLPVKIKKYKTTLIDVAFITS